MNTPEEVQQVQAEPFVEVVLNRLTEPTDSVDQIGKA